MIPPPIRQAVLAETRRQFFARRARTTGAAALTLPANEPMNLDEVLNQ